MLKCTSHNFMWYWMGGEVKGVKARVYSWKKGGRKRGRERERRERSDVFTPCTGTVLVKCHVSFMNMYIHTGNGQRGGLWRD